MVIDNKGKGNNKTADNKDIDKKGDKLLNH